MLSEKQTEWIINNNLINKGWCIDGDDKRKNVFFQRPKLESQREKLNGKRPDFILYASGTDKPIAIIEAKKSGSNLDPALRQGIDYAVALDAPIVLAMNGTYCETYFVPNGKSLILNGNEVRELLREAEALKFLRENSNEVYTIPKEIIVSREDLIKTFKNLNDTLRSEGLRAGIERFSEFTNILFLKLISENHSKPWWDSIKKQSNDDIIGYINGYVIKEIQNEYGGNVFTSLDIKNPSTLRHIIDSIDPLTLSTMDTDVKGDAFEYFLERTTSTENDLGEYFTPRNVVKTIVNLVDPKFKEKIYDPFCGTGGFLTSAFHYIRENSKLDQKDLKRLQNDTIFGNEITSNARIAKMNMILNGDGHSGIKQIDSLANPVDDLFDVVVTNMPFSQKLTRQVMINGKMKTENRISSLYYNGLAKNSGDATCVLHCLRALKKGGRMALVVPEGFLFQQNLAKVREYLLSIAKLQSVISLPQGTFLPYTGVKTSILYFTDVHTQNNQKQYWYFEVKNIGVTLDNNKSKIKGLNDFDKINSSDIKKADKYLDLKDNMLEIGFELIDMVKVRENTYNLIGRIYRESRKDSKYQVISINELCNSNIITLEKGKTITKEKVEKGHIPVIAGGKKSPYSHNKSTHDGNVITISASGAYSGYVWYHDNPIWASDCHVIFSNNENILHTKYLYYVLFSLQPSIYKLQHGSGQPHIYANNIKTIQIPLPSLEEQQKIVDELDSYQKIIGGAKQVIDSWKPYFKAENIENVVKIKDICEINPKKSNIKDKSGLSISFIPMETIIAKKMDVTTKLEKNIEDAYNGYTYFATNDLLIAKISPCFENGKMAIARKLKNNIGFGSTEFIVVRIKDNNFVLVEWIYYCLKNQDFLKYGKSSMTGSIGHQRISLDFIKNYYISLPPLHVQQQIIDQLEIERKYIESQVELIKLLEQKMQDRLNSLWNRSEDIDKKRCLALAVEIVRRPSKGGSV